MVFIQERTKGLPGLPTPIYIYILELVIRVVLLSFSKRTATRTLLGFSVWKESSDVDRRGKRVCCLYDNLEETSIKVKLAGTGDNSGVTRLSESRRGQGLGWEAGHVICQDQSEISVQVT